MQAFTYRAVDARGKRLRGREEARSVQELTSALEGRGLLVLEAGEATARSSIGRLGSRRSVLEATRALASLLPAGLPLARALEVVEGLSNGAVADAIGGVRVRVQRGDQLHAALADHPRGRR